MMVNFGSQVLAQHNTNTSSEVIDASVLNLQRVVTTYIIINDMLFWP
jgi:hypothetical protein